MAAVLAKGARPKKLSARIQAGIQEGFPRLKLVCHAPTYLTRHTVHENRKLMLFSLGSINTELRHDINQPSDRGSIEFLLNLGTASFVECFRLPSSSDRRNTFDYNNDANEASRVNIPDACLEEASNFSDPFENDAIDWSAFEDEALIGLLSNPLRSGHLETDDIFGPMFMNYTSKSNDPINDLNLGAADEWEAPSPQSTAIVQAIFNSTDSLQLSTQERAVISQPLYSLFSATKIERLIDLYFEFWHPHCPIVHRPSFSVETTPIPLLISMSLMGAMYSQVDKDSVTAKPLLDLAEHYIFTLEDLTPEFEIRQALRAQPPTSPEQSTMHSLLAFQHLQAAYIMVCLQFWAGNAVSRKRAIETRFGVVIKVISFQ